MAATIPARRPSPISRAYHHIETIATAKASRKEKVSVWDVGPAKWSQLNGSSMPACHRANIGTPLY